MNNCSKILIVDDEEDILESLSFNLSHKGFEVLTATSGHLALKKFKQNPDIKAILTDINMPNGNGIELLKEIKKTAPLFPVLSFISGYSELTIREAFNLGANSIFSKPFELQLIIDNINWHLLPNRKRWAHKFHPEPTPTLITTGTSSVGNGGIKTHLDVSVLPTIKKDKIVPFHANSDIGEISGHGWVRWIDSDKHEIGLEFFYLEEEPRSRISEWIENNKPKSFIPG